MILLAVALSGSVSFGCGMVSAQRSSGAKQAEGPLERVQLRASQSEVPSTPASTQERTASSDEIKRAEQALKSHGFNPGRIDGKIEQRD
jgi:hypothetical protein